MKTYSESRGRQPFDWNAFLENPPAEDSDEHGAACGLSWEWVTCACGNLCDKIPRDISGAPLDAELKSLGVEFHENIRSGYWNGAKDCLYLIEKRSAGLIKYSS